MHVNDVIISILFCMHRISIWFAGTVCLITMIGLLQVMVGTAITRSDA